MLHECSGPINVWVFSVPSAHTRTAARHSPRRHELLDERPTHRLKGLFVGRFWAHHARWEAVASLSVPVFDLHRAFCVAPEFLAALSRVAVRVFGVPSWASGRIRTKHCGATNEEEEDELDASSASELVAFFFFFFFDAAPLAGFMAVAVAVALALTVALVVSTALGASSGTAAVGVGAAVEVAAAADDCRNASISASDLPAASASSREANGAFAIEPPAPIDS